MRGERKGAGDKEAEQPRRHPRSLVVDGDKASDVKRIMAGPIPFDFGDQKLALRVHGTGEIDGRPLGVRLRKVGLMEPADGHGARRVFDAR